MLAKIVLELKLNAKLGKRGGGVAPYLPQIQGGPIIHVARFLPCPASQLKIRRDDLRHPAVISLLEEHLDDMASQSPAESMHALDLEELRQPDISFWSAWDGDRLMGCGALKKLDATHGEIKSMRTTKAYLRQGVAAAMLRHIINEAVLKGMRRLSLETGSMAGFSPARELYLGFGFEECEPFADYELDPNSIFMTKVL